MSGMNEDDIGRYIIEKLKKAGRTQPLILPEAVKALSNACQGSSRKLKDPSDSLFNNRSCQRKK
ncbi:MAG: hypothetical protein V8R64_08390 [Thomasclavelia sp.]